MDTDLPPVSGHDTPAFGQAKPQPASRIPTGKERVKSVRAFDSCQLGAIVTEIDLEPPTALPGPEPGAKSNSTSRFRSQSDRSCDVA